MASRDHFEKKIKCPNCDEKGVLHYSDNDYPGMRNNNRRVDSVEGNFTASMSGDSDIKITCGNCGKEFIV